MIIDKIPSLIEEYGWTCKTFQGEESGKKYVLTFVNPESDLKLKVVIMIKQSQDWLYISTHKLFKFEKDQAMPLFFLQNNAWMPAVKWFVRGIKDTVYVNIGFEMFATDFSKKTFFRNLDIMSYYIDDTLAHLKKEQKITEDNLTRMEAIEKSCLELH